MLPEEVTRYIGKVLGVRVFEVEKGAIKKFADSVGDYNPLFWDDEYARDSRYGSIIAPPGFFGWPGRWLPDMTFPPNPESSPFKTVEEGPRTVLARHGFSRNLDGGMEYEFFLPVRAGDALTAETIVKDITTREGRTGNIAFVTSETTYYNQNGDLVAKATATQINR